MKTIKRNKLWKYLFWLSPFLFVTGLTAGLVSESWGPIPLTFLILGIAIGGLWLVWQSKQSNWWGRRSTLTSTNALVATLAVLVILGLVNFLGTRYHLRIDFTDTQWFTLAPESRDLIRSLQQPVKVWVFDVTKDPQDEELLKIYRRQNPKFEFEYVDPQTKLGLANKFGVNNYGEVYLEYQDKRQLVQEVDRKTRLSEVKLTNRLLQITSSNTAKVYFLQGHGERQLSPNEGGISQAIAVLRDKKYTIEPLDLAQKPSVPQDANVVVVAGPKRALFEGEVKALQDYLNRGGNLLLMIDPGTDPKLDSLLTGWGVKLDNRLVVDVSGQLVGRGPAAPIVTEYGQHPITKVFGNGISFYRLAQPVETNPIPGIETTPLLFTKPYPQSWAESDLQSENLEFNPEKDLKGPLTLGVALKKKISITSTPSPQASPKLSQLPSPTKGQVSATSTTTPSPLPSPTKGQVSSTPTTTPSPLPSPTKGQVSPTSTTTPSPLPSPTQGQVSTTTTATATPASEEKSGRPAIESRLVVLGNSDFATNGLFEQQLNGDVFLNSVTWLSQQDRQLLSISPKEPKNRQINLTSTQAKLLTLSSVFVLPLIGLIAAVVIWWQRR